VVSRSVTMGMGTALAVAEGSGVVNG
jgi:hypothetical protein